MPTGPGDEILDAIERGDADDAVMGKYKINGDQLRAFKSLHYGLSNQKMGYNEIGNYYPELKSYFNAPSPVNAPASEIPKEDFTKPIKQKAVTESTAAPANLKDFAQAAESGKAGKTLQEKFDKKVKASQQLVNTAIHSNDDVIEKMIRAGRYNQAKEAGLTDYAAAPKTDMPAANILATMRQRYIEPEVKAQDLPVSPDEIAQTRQEFKANEPQARQFINQIVVNKPAEAKQLQTAMYMLDASARMQQNPNIGLKVNENLHKLDKGELKYNSQTGQLIREEGFLDSIISGVRERTKQLHDYDLFQKPDADVIKLLEKRMASYNPDEPVPVPTGAGEIGQMAGMEWASLLKGAGIGIASSLASNPEVAPYITAAINAPEYYKRGYSTAFEEVYTTLRRQGKSPEEALSTAKEQADYEGKLGAAEGAISSIVGGRIGLKELPKYNITGGFKNAVKSVITKTAHYAGEASIEGLADGLVAGYLQEQKDIAAEEKGVHRDQEQSIKDNIRGELTFSVAMAAITKAGSALIDPEVRKKLLYHIAKQPNEAIDQKIGEMVMDGQMTDEEAKVLKNVITEQKAVQNTTPDDIKDVSRIAMINKIKERDALEEKKKNTDKALWPPLQKQIDDLNKEILEHSTHKIETNETETKAEAETGEGVLKTEQPGVAGKVEEPAASAELRWTNPETGQQFVLRDEKLYSVDKDGNEGEFSEQAMQSKHVKEVIANIKAANQNAVQEQGTTGVHVPPSSGDSPAMGKGDESKGPVNEGAAETQEVSAPQQKFYESAIGGQPNMTGRVPVSPIVGGTPKTLRQIIKDVSAGLKQKVIYAKPGRARAIGSYLPWFKGIKIRYTGDIDTTAHELGHSIDDHFDIYTKAINYPGAIKEMEEFAKHGGSTPPANHPNPDKYIRQEGFAEWLRAYVANPQQAKALAPHLTALFKSTVNYDFQQVINRFSDDFRTWRGATGRDITMANVDYEPQKKPNALQQLWEQEETNSEFAINYIDRFAANYLNPLHAFEKAWEYAKGIRGIRDVLPEKDPIILSRILNGIDGKFGEILKSGMINSRGEVLKAGGGTMLYDQKGRLIKQSGTVKNLEWLLSDLDNTDAGTLERDMKDVIAFMVAERTVELSKKFGRGEVLTGIGGGVMSDFSVALKTLNEFHSGDPNRLDRVQKAAEKYREFADDILQYAVEKGRLSQEQYSAIKADNEYYVALQRILETAPGDEIIMYPRSGGKELGAKGEITHTIKGSTRAIVNPYVSLLDNLYKTIRESDRNEVLQAFRDMLVSPRDMNQGTPKRIADIGIIGKKGDDQSIPIFINGKPEYWIFQQDIYKGLKAFDLDPFRVWTAFTIPAKVLRFTTTHFPTFAVRNWLRDTQDRMIKSTTGSSLSHLIGSKEDWNALARYGGLNSGYYLKDKHHYYGLLTEAMDVMAKDKGIIIADPVMLKHLWHKYEDLLYKGETSNRVAEYRSAFKKAQEQGMDNYNASLYAAFKARDLIDFAVAGHHMQKINQVIPFTNAAVQGLRSAAVSAGKNPKTWGAFGARLFLYSIVPGVAAWFMNHNNEDDKKLYEEMPPYQRDMFWNFRIGPNKWLSLPKPYELALPQAGIDRMLSYYLADNKKAFDGYAADVRKLLLPFDEGNIAGPYQAVIEGMTNHDWFRDQTVIPPNEDPLDLSLRHTETASRLGQLLQKFSGWDARKWDHFIKRSFSYVGNFSLKASDIGKSNSRHEFDLTDTGIFKRSPAYNSNSVQQMVQFAKTWDLTKTPPYKQFNLIVGRYFTADTDEEQEKIGKELIDRAAQMLATWQEKHMTEFKEKRAAAKKAKGR